MDAPVFTWTPESEDILRRMYSEGETAQAIALKVGAPSRSAVLGKVHRLGINRNPGVEAPKPGPRAKRVVPHNIVAKMATEPTPLQAAAALKGRGVEVRMQRTIAEQRPNGDAGVLFLERGPMQCAMPMPGWDDLPVTDKRVCGREVTTLGSGAMTRLTSWCPVCFPLVFAPAGITRMKDKAMQRGLEA